MSAAHRPPTRSAVAETRAIRGFQQPVADEHAVVALSDAQRGLITTRQLLAAGVQQDAIERRVRSGRLTRIHSGVFAVGRAKLDPLARWKAATLAGGSQAMLGHLHAGGLWEAWVRPAGVPHIVIPGNGRRGHRGVVVHRMRRFHPDDRAVVKGIPVTSLPLTALHLAGILSRPSFERALVKAARRSEFNLVDAIALADRSQGRPGVRVFRQVIARDLTAELRCLSELELRFIELLRAHGIELPEVNHDVEALMVDAVWHRARVVIELDGFEFHKLPRDLRSDNARNRKLVLAGYRVIRFVWRDLVDDPGGVAATVATLLGSPSHRNISRLP